MAVIIALPSSFVLVFHKCQVMTVCSATRPSSHIPGVGDGENEKITRDERASVRRWGRGLSTCVTLKNLGCHNTPHIGYCVHWHILPNYGLVLMYKRWPALIFLIPRLFNEIKRKCRCTMVDHHRMLSAKEVLGGGERL